MSNIIIFEADAEGYFRFVNPQTLKVFGVYDYSPFI